MLKVVKGGLLVSGLSRGISLEGGGVGLVSSILPYSVFLTMFHTFSGRQPASPLRDLLSWFGRPARKHKHAARVLQQPIILRFRP